MKFVKMHGIGNDYVYVNCFEENVPEPEKMARFVSNRHFGIGSDGLILICPSETADCEMKMYNADGSESPMCGNGIRCVAKFVYDYGIVHKEEITVATGSGLKRLFLTVENGKVRSVRVNMGSPILDPAQIPVKLTLPRVINEPINAGDLNAGFTAVSMGNPHAVLFLNSISDLDLPKIGPIFENHPLFPERINTEFVQVVNEHELSMRVWERGSGETLACGTGACAVCVAAVLNGHVDPSSPVTIHLLGGDLEIFWNQRENTVYMTGPAVTVYEGNLLCD